MSTARGDEQHTKARTLDVVRVLLQDGSVQAVRFRVVAQLLTQQRHVHGRRHTLGGEPGGAQATMSHGGNQHTRHARSYMNSSRLRPCASQPHPGSHATVTHTQGPQPQRPPQVRTSARAMTSRACLYRAIAAVVSPSLCSSVAMLASNCGGLGRPLRSSALYASLYALRAASCDVESGLRWCSSASWMSASTSLRRL